MRLGDDDSGESLPFYDGDEKFGDDRVGIVSSKVDVDRHGEG